MEKSGKTGRKVLWLLFILFLALFVASCASSAEKLEKKGLESLKSSVEAFNAAFKWEEYTTAADFLPHEKKAEFWKEVDQFKGKLRITDIEVRDVEVATKGTSGVAILHFQYWRPEAPVLKEATITQRWYYTDKDKLWRVSDSGFEAISGTNVRF